MSRFGYVFLDVTRDVVGIPPGVERVFQVFAYDSGDICSFYGSRYDLRLCRTVCVGGGESAYEYADILTCLDQQWRDMRVDEVRALPVIEFGQTPTGNCRSRLYKVPRKREYGESRHDYHTAIIEFALDCDQANPLFI